MNNIQKIIKPKLYTTIQEIVISEISPPFCSKCKKFLTDDFCKSEYIRKDCYLRHVFDHNRIFKKS